MDWIYIYDLKDLGLFNLQLIKHCNCIVHRKKYKWDNTNYVCSSNSFYLLIDKLVV